MPIHSYYCDSCKQDWLEYYKLSTTVPERLPCPKCRLFSGVRQFPQTHTHRDFNKPVEHYSLAPVHHEDVTALRAKLPAEVEMSIDPKDEMYGIPISRNETERQAVLRAAGYVDKGKSK
jgi:hypothetical protein